MKKMSPLSGFPEWSPEERLVETRVIEHLQRTFELFGFTPLETRSVEPLEVLLEKGEVDKEIYVLRRLQAGEAEADKNLALHFDLTVPFARYVAQNRGQLSFPFKRYQIQKAWRGERPQDGRFREFYQADFDVIGENELPISYDLEMPLLLHEILDQLPIPPVTLLINNRKVLEGFCRGLRIDDGALAIRILDKLDKIGEDAVRKQLMGMEGGTTRQAEKLLALAQIRTPDASFADEIRKLEVDHELLEKGIEELSFVMNGLAGVPKGRVLADLHIARGLDYYTGTVYEGVLTGHEGLGAVCSGGRYDDLASGSSSLKLPGVGISIGITRILSRLFKKKSLSTNRPTPVCVLVALVDEASRPLSLEVASRLRARGIAADLAPRPVKYGKQIQLAQRRGIPFVWFPPADPSSSHEVRDIRSGVQGPADASLWEPPPEDRNVRLVRLPRPDEGPID